MGVVDVVLVRDGHMPARLAVRVLMSLMGDVTGDSTLIDVVLVRPVQVTVVHIVNVIAMWDGGVSAALPVRVIVTGVQLVRGGGRHRINSWQCWTARRVFRATHSSVSAQAVSRPARFPPCQRDQSAGWRSADKALP
jgi:hypothetical protein